MSRSLPSASVTFRANKPSPVESLLQRLEACCAHRSRSHIIIVFPVVSVPKFLFDALSRLRMLGHECCNMQCRHELVSDAVKQSLTTTQPLARTPRSQHELLSCQMLQSRDPSLRVVSFSFCRMHAPRRKAGSSAVPFLARQRHPKLRYHHPMIRAESRCPRPRRSKPLPRSPKIDEIDARRFPLTADRRRPCDVHRPRALEVPMQPNMPLNTATLTLFRGRTRLRLRRYTSRTRRNGATCPRSWIRFRVPTT